MHLSGRQMLLHPAVNGQLLVIILVTVVVVVVSL